MYRIACKIVFACILLGFLAPCCHAVGSPEVARTVGAPPAPSYDVVYDWKSQNPPGGALWHAIAVSSDGTRIVAVERGGYIYTSADSGTTWIQRIAVGNRAWTAVASSSDGTKLVAVDDLGTTSNGGYIYTSADSGVAWTQRTAVGARSWSGVASSSDGTRLAAADNGGYIYTSADSGATWTKRTGAGEGLWNAIASSSNGTRLVAVGYNGIIYTSTDAGSTWTRRESSADFSWLAVASSSDGATLVVGGYRNNAPGGAVLWTSTDSGATWTKQTTPNNLSPYSMAVASSSDGTRLVALEYGGYICTSTDSGATWTQHVNANFSYTPVVASSSDGTRLVAAEEEGYIYTSADSGATWTQLGSPSQGPQAVASSSDGTRLAAAQDWYIYTSTDSGNTWTQRTIAGRNYWTELASSSDGGTLIATAWANDEYTDKALYTSTDSGETWTEYAGTSPHIWTAVAASADGAVLVAVDGSGCILTSTDSGKTWSTQVFEGTYWSAVASSSDGTKLVAAGGGYIYTSTDSGATWTQQTGAGRRSWNAVASSSDGARIVAAVEFGSEPGQNWAPGFIYTSTDSGATWTQLTGAGCRYWVAVASSSDGTRLAASDMSISYETTLISSDNRIYVSGDSGATWMPQPNIPGGTSLWLSPDGSKIATVSDLLYTGSASSTSPYIFSPVASSLTTSSVTLGATIESGAAPTVTAAGIAYGLNVNPDITGSMAPTAATTGPFTVDVTGLTSNTPYYFRGYLTNSEGPGYSANGLFTTIPDAPVSKAASGKSHTGFTANWTAPPGTAEILEYLLDVATDPGFNSPLAGYNDFPVSGTSQTITGIAAGKTYYYRVRAVNAGGAGASSKVIAVAIATSTPCLDTPAWSSVTTSSATLGATITSDQGSTIRTSGVAYGTGSNPGITGNIAVTGHVVTGGAFTVSVSGLTANTVYNFRGFAVNGIGAGYTDDSIFTTVSNPPKATPASEITPTGFTANWSVPPGTAGIYEYRLDVATDSDFKSPLAGYNNLAVSSGHKCAVTGIVGAQTYYRVRAVNDGGTSSNSNVVKVSIPPIVVTSPGAGENWATGSTHTITWRYTGSIGSEVYIEFLHAYLSIPIASGVSIGSNGTGSYSWTIPASWPPESGCTIRVSCMSAPSCFGESPGAFTITKHGKAAASRVSASAVLLGTAPAVADAAQSAFGISSAQSSAGPDQVVTPSAVVELDGSNSIRPTRQDISSYLWKQIDGPPVILSNPSSAKTEFTAPDAGASGQSLVFELTVTDQEGAHSQDTCIVNVIRDNPPPTVDAGPDQIATGAQIVRLDGSRSRAAGGRILSYAWRQVSGIPVGLGDPASMQPTFVAPDVQASGQSLVFELTVTDQAGLRSRDTCIVSVVSQKQPPRADAGRDQTVQPGAWVVLDGTGSSDEDGAIGSYRWKQLLGPPVTLSNPAAAVTTFTAPVVDDGVEKLVFQLFVTDTGGLEDCAGTTVTVSREIISNRTE